MNNSDTALEIRTLGRFGIFIDGKQVAKDWPDETIKVLFCSLLSPLGLYITWDRICRSMWDVPVTQTNRHRLEELFIRHLDGFLDKELGFSPLVTGHEGIRIIQKRIHLDAHDFYRAAVEGNRLMSRGNHAAALAHFSRVDSLYTGSYLPGVPGEIIESTRNDLDTIYRQVVHHSVPFIRNAGYSGLSRGVEPGMFLMSA